MFDIGIIGAGPAGYTAAIRAAQLGLTVVLFEKDKIGGTCLNRGCIPTKTILHSCNLYNEIKNTAKFGVNCENISFDFEKIQERQKNISEKIRKNLTNLIKSYNNITIVEEEAKIKNNNTIETQSQTFEVKNIIIATGSKPNKIKLTGNYDSNYILTSDDILELNQLPKSILITGSGAIGIEWARILSSLGVKVCIIEMADKLIPQADYEISERIVRLLKKSRIEFYTSTVINNIDEQTITLSNGKTIEAQKILLAAGRLPIIGDDVPLNNIETNKFITTDENFKTTANNIYAIGDVNGKSMLAHSAMKQAEQVISYINDYKTAEFCKNLVPAVIYGTPEIAFIGKTEQELIEQNIQYKKSMFPISALGKAYADDKIEGFVKVLANKNEILGAHIISEEASALIEQFAIAMTKHISPKALDNVIFAHPTYSEAIGEAVLGLDNLAIHIPQAK